MIQISILIVTVKARSHRYRAVRMVIDDVDDFASDWTAITSVTGKLGMAPETLRHLVRRAQVDGGH